MTAIPDLEKCNYFPVERENFVAIGWLGENSEYIKGSVSTEYFEKIKLLATNPWQPIASAGIHYCELCQYDKPAFKSNLFIPYNSRIYVAPEAIVHYSASHWYQPPEIFVQAVLQCPEMRSMEYKKSVLANGGRSLVSLANA